MKKFLMGAAAATLLMTGCADNELLVGGIATPNDGKIYFSATSGVPTNTRAAVGNPINSTNDLQKIGAFTVQGFVEGAGAAYVNAIPTFNGVSWEYTNEPYWPNTWMDFYAHANWGTAPTIDPAGGITAATVAIGQDALDATGQKDLLVAITPNANKEVRTLLTFKHALTQIVFKAGNINPSKITADITGVEIVNVGTVGSMTFKKGEKIKWTTTGVVAADDKPKYTVAGIGSTIATGFKVPDLSATPNDFSKYPRIQTVNETDNNALMLLPQAFAAWNPNSGTVASANAQIGAYIKLKVLVKRADFTFGTNQTDDNENNKYIYAGKSNNGVLEAGDVYIPIESLWDADQTGLNAGAWVPGKRINYIITFGDSNSGSGGGGYDEDGDPILVPIRFRAVVEDWVETDVPLLTATFEATSSAITHKFIDGYTNQLLNDIKAAPAPKVYKAEIKLKGSNSANIGVTAGGLDYATTNIIGANVTFQNLLDGTATFQNAKFVPGSTLKYDMTGVTNLDTRNAKIVVPTGWVGQRTKDGTIIDVVPVAADLPNDGSVLTLEGTTANGVLLTKVAATGYSYVAALGYLENNIATVELNENYTAAANVFNNTITVKNPFPTIGGNNYYFSSDMLAKFTASGYNNSTLTVELKDVTLPTETAAGAGVDGQKYISTNVPQGWTVEKKTGANPAIVYQLGDLVTVTKLDYDNAGAGNPVQLIYTKQTSNITGNNWKNELELVDWIGSTKTSLNNEFWYDNVDGLIEVDFTKIPFNAHTNFIDGNKIHFKNNVGKVKESDHWTWEDATKAAIYSSSVKTVITTYIYVTSQAQMLSILSSGATKDVIYIVDANAPSDFTNPAMNVTGLNTGEKIYVKYNAGSQVPTDLSTGWTWDDATNTATYTNP